MPILAWYAAASWPECLSFIWAIGSKRPDSRMRNAMINFKCPKCGEELEVPWCFHGEKDTTVPTLRSRNMIEAINKARGEPNW
jgi:hypothetical protein